ncbi:hypothetical protein B0H14DRAFT_3535765 [Mycena olivaceomarginata]|nr:hypothetical protein B0H14DRAFT_3535765 [Mycena olivaceomarginata]
MNIFNPKILDASIRDAALCLSDNQKVYLLLHTLGSLPQDGPPTRRESCGHADVWLRGTNWAPRKVYLQAALVAEPDNPEAKALLHHCSVAVEKVRCHLYVVPSSLLIFATTIATTTYPAPRPHAPCQLRFSDEIWREIVLWLPRQDRKTLLFVLNALSRVASQLLFRQLDLDLSRTADILTCVIVNPSFGGFVRTLCIYLYAMGKDESMAFQMGMLANTLTRMGNLQNVYISALSENTVPLLRVLQPIYPISNAKPSTTSHSPPREGPQGVTNNFIAENRSLRTVSLHNMSWIFPSEALSLRNLTSIAFSGHLPPSSTPIADILTHGRQLDTLSLTCTLECLPASQFRAATGALPFLQHFALTVCGAVHRPGSADLFPAVADFLRARTELQTLTLVVREETDQRTGGFDAAVWGVLPSLTHLKTFTITYLRDPRHRARGVAAPALAAHTADRLRRGATRPCAIPRPAAHGDPASKSSMFSSLRKKVSQHNLRTSNAGTDKSDYPPLRPPPLLNAGGFVSFLPIPSPPPMPRFKRQKKKPSQGDDVPPASIRSSASSASSNSASALTSKSTTTTPILAALTARPRPVPPALRRRYDTLFSSLYSAHARRPALLAPRRRTAAGWRGLSVDLIRDLAGSETLAGPVVCVLWVRSRLPMAVLSAIWMECDPARTGALG